MYVDCALIVPPNHITNAKTSFNPVLDQDDLDKARSVSDPDAVSISSVDAWKLQDFTNTRLNLSINSLSLLMCQPEYKIAEAKVSSLAARVENKWGNTRVDGTLGALALEDLTPHGSALYPLRFSTMGRQVS